MTEPQRIKSVVEKFMRKLTGGDIGLIRGSWKSLLGEEDAMHAVPVSLKGGRLFVEVDSSVWIQHLTMKKKSILEGLNNIGMEKPVDDIYFRAGK